MRKKWFKKLGAAFCAAVLSISCLNLTAFAAGETITSFTPDDYKEMTGLAATSGSIEITKKLSDVDNTDFGTGDKAIQGVEFSIAKVGEYATVVDTDGTTSVMIGINKDLAEEALSEAAKTNPDLEELDGTEPEKDAYVYLTASQYNSINAGLRNVSVEDLESYIDAILPQKTEEDGVTTFSTLGFGIYLVLETNVANATVDGEPVAFSQKQYPYIVSVPVYVEDQGWNADVEARAKNDTDEVDITKKIVRNSNDLSKNVGANDTDVTHVGDTVEFTLTADVPKLDANAGSIDSYEINDVISKGLTLPDTFSKDNIYIEDGLGIEYELNTHFTVVKPNNNDPDIAKEFSKENSPYIGGSSFTIVFTPAGRTKLTTVAKDTTGDEKKFVRVSYTATVNADAVVGVTGNPNEVQLQYAAAGSKEISTGWDEVREFIFTMEGTKTFDNVVDAAKAQSVTFELYLDEACNTGVVLSGSDGVYTYQNTGSATEITLNADSKFTVKGVPVYNETTDTNDTGIYQATLYLKETATEEGYNKLTKVIPIVLTAAKQTADELAEYTGVLAISSTVNGQNATLVNNNTGVSFTVDNTEGFQLPSTGGMGIWIFVIAGVLVVAAGIFYYKRSKKRA